MNVDKLYDLYNNNLGSILTSSMLSTISDRTYDIHGYNLVNRLLIYIQNKYTTSLKGETAWNIVGRTVKDKASPIWVIENIVKTTYVDPETGTDIEDIGMNPKEIEDAVKYGTIQRVKSIEGLKCLPVYNIKDTIIFDSDIYREFVKNEHKGIKLSTLFSVTSSEFGFAYSKGDEKSSYDPETNSVFIGSEYLYDKIAAISNGIMHQIGAYDIILDFVNEYGIEEDRVLRIVELCKLVLTESLVSFCDKSHDVDSSAFSDMDNLEITDQSEITCFMQILSAVYDTIEDLVQKLNPDSKNISESTLRKAAELLNILEANDAIMKYRG